MGDSQGHLTGKGTVTNFAQTAAVLLRQMVIDETNIKGFYDFELRWTAPPPLPGTPPPPNTLGPDGIALFMTTVKERFGLRFTGATGPVEYWVIDHIEQPTEN